MVVEIKEIKECKANRGKTELTRDVVATVPHVQVVQVELEKGCGQRLLVIQLAMPVVVAMARRSALVDHDDGW